MSLQEMIKKRIGVLPAPARRMIEAVSLAAQPIEVDVVRQVAGLGEGEQAARNNLIVQKLIRFRRTEGGGEVEPYHDKIREAVVAGLSGATRQAYFHSLGAALEARESADPEIVYQYFVAAGNPAKAEAWVESRRAGQRALWLSTWPLRLREKRIELGTAQGAGAFDTSGTPRRGPRPGGEGLKAARMFQTAAQGAGPDKYCELIRKAGEQYIRSGHFAEGQALLTALLSGAGSGCTPGNGKPFLLCW